MKLHSLLFLILKLLFKCKHEHKHLGVARDATIVSIDRVFDGVTYHLYCRKCDKELTIEYGKFKVSGKEHLREINLKNARNET